MKPSASSAAVFHRATAGFTLVGSMVILALLATLGSFFISSVTTDIQIARAQSASTQAYYLAESAVAEMVWKLRNDLPLQYNFIAGTIPSGTRISRANVFTSSDSYEATAQSTGVGLARVTATGRVPTKEGVATRTIIQMLARATGDYEEILYSLLAGGTGGQENGDVEIGTAVNVSGGVLHSNHDLRVKQNATLTVTGGDAEAVNNITVHPSGTLTISGGQSRQGVPALPMPQIDFDSTAQNSLKNRATQVLTPAQFNALPSGTTLTGLIFVDGSPGELEGALTVEGMLIINGDFEIESPALLTIRRYPLGSGLLVKNNLTIESNAAIEGAMYAGAWLSIVYPSSSSGALNVQVTGGMIGWRIRISTERGGAPFTVTVTYDKNLLSDALVPILHPDAPVITLSHWEESY